MNLFENTNSKERLAIAGIASIQTCLRQLEELDPVFKKINVDGIIGPLMIDALNELAYGLQLKPHLIENIQETCEFEVVQVWYNWVTSPQRTVFSRLEEDGWWGTSTKKAFDNLIVSYIESKMGDLTGKRWATLHRETRAHRTLTSQCRVLAKAGPVEYVWHGSDEAKDFYPSPMVKQAAFDILAKAMNFDNPVVAPEQMVASGYKICWALKGKVPVGVIVLRPSIGMSLSSSIEHCSGHLVGLYVAEQYRTNGVGVCLTASAQCYFKDELNARALIFSADNAGEGPTRVYNFLAKSGWTMDPFINGKLMRRL